MKYIEKVKLVSGRQMSEGLFYLMLLALEAKKKRYASRDFLKEIGVINKSNIKNKKK